MTNVMLLRYPRGPYAPEIHAQFLAMLGIEFDCSFQELPVPGDPSHDWLAESLERIRSADIIICTHIHVARRCCLIIDLMSGAPQPSPVYPVCNTLEAVREAH